MVIIENIEDLIDIFKMRYCIISVIQLEEVMKMEKIDYIKKNRWSDSWCILDCKEKNPVLFSKENIKSKTFEINDKYDLSFLDNYIVDKSYFYQSDKVSPNLGSNGIEKMYGIGHIWLGYTYYSKSGKKRMCINTNLFGNYKTINSREQILENLINS